MKKYFMFLVTGMIFIVSCVKFDGGAPSTPTTLACDNTVNPLTVQLYWPGTYYNCTSGSFGTMPPPTASAYNYLSIASAMGGTGSLSNSNAYLCTIVVKNDQPSETPNTPCSKPGMLSYTWAVAGAGQTISCYKNHNTDITVDYYDVCAICNSSGTARPHFTGVATFVAGVTGGLVQMTTQPYANCQ